MAKLVKLTNIDDRINTDNSFRCQCDDDIIIQPNATVSLLNAHISSGLISTYNVAAPDTIGQVSGEKIGTLNLTANPRTDLSRDVIVPTGSYQISGLLSNLTNAFNSALQFNSSSRTVSASSNTLELPTNPDFGCTIKTGLTPDNLVQIKYNSIAQVGNGAQNNPISYSQLQPGVVNNNGIISFGGTNPVETDLLATQADNILKIVRSPYNITTQFAAFDTITLVNKSNPALTATGQIASITVSSTLDGAIDIDPYNPANPGVVLSTDLVSAIGVLPFGNGDDVSLDDGTGVFGTPSATQVSGTLSLISESPINDNYEINSPNSLLGYTLRDTIVVETIDEPNNKLQLALPNADAADNHIINGAIWHVNSINTGQPIAAFTVAVDTTQPFADKTIITVSNIINFNGTLNYDEWFEIASLEFYETNDYPGKALTDLAIADGDILHVYNSAYDIKAEAEIDTISQDGDKFVFELLAGSIKAYNPNTNTLETGVDAYIYWLDEKGNTQDSDTPFNKAYSVMTKSVNASGLSLAQNDPIVFEDSITGLYAGATFTVADTPFDIMGGSHAIIPCSISGANATDIFVKWGAFTKMIVSANDWSIYKTNANKKYAFTITNVVDGTGSPANLTNTLTRIWQGVGITGRSNVSLLNIRADVRNFDQMIKGNNIPLQPTAMALEDHVLSPSCGRVAFLVNTVGTCEFGVLQQPANFTNATGTLNGDLRVVIVPNGPDFVYRIYRYGAQLSFKTTQTARSGDLVVIQWGASPNNSDFEYVPGLVSQATTPQQVLRNIATYTDASSGQIDPADRGNVLFSVIRAGQSRYTYFGSPLDTPANNQPIQARIYPYTPRGSPYIQPPKWNQSAKLQVYIAPNAAEITCTELTATAMTITENGITKEFDGSHAIFNESQHTVESPELVNTPTKYNSAANAFDFEFTNPTLQRQLGYKISSNPQIGLSGSWNANQSYIASYLPENVCILLDTIGSVQTYDCSRTKGSRRSIIATATNTQSAQGEINIEPSNLYRIKVGNKDPINLRKFVVSFEDFYGAQIQLQSARAVVNLLFE